MADNDAIKRALNLIFAGIKILKDHSNQRRRFTIDGRLVGDIGEIIAEREFEITLDDTQRRGHDAKTLDGRDVQIKATFKSSLTFTSEPMLYIGLKLFPDGTHEIVFNGPGKIISSAYEHRKGIGTKQLSFSIAKLKELSKEIPESDRVRFRKN